SALPGASSLVPKAKRQSVSKTNIDKVKPVHFAVATRAMHLKYKVRANVGVKLEKLICAGARAVRARQRQGVKRFFDGSARALHQHDAGKLRQVHVSYSHLWDEVRAKFRWRPSTRYRKSKKNNSVPTLVQRGVFGFGMYNGKTEKKKLFKEYWLVDPRELQGTKAKHIEPGIVESMPKELNLKDVDGAAMLLSQVSSYTFMPMGVMASSNMYILKDWGKFYESTLLPRFGGRLLFFPDNCGTHKHHRAKRDLKDLKRHILRHYSMNKLLREQNMQRSCSDRLEVLVKQKVKRRIGKPPEDALTLREVVGIIFHLDAEWHKRARGKTSQFYTDLVALCNHINGCVLADEMIHWCWEEEAATDCHRCATDVTDESIECCHNAFFGKADPEPAASRWANVLPNMQRTVLRRVLWGIGTGAIVGGPENVIVDEVQFADEADDNFINALQWVRRKTTNAYLKDDATFKELGVYIIMLDVFDGELLFPLLGDPFKAEPKPENVPKLSLILDPNKSKVAPSNNQITNIIELDYRVVESHEQTRVGH
ncbi:hypothetical protein N9L68_08450, partial [bacterium]|nr:hypothetical protein [bacterium]